jgi:hypothetical protein
LIGFQGRIVDEQGLCGVEIDGTRDLNIAAARYVEGARV